MGAQAYDQRARQREIANLKKRAQKLGLSIVETENHAALAGYSQKHAWIYQAIVDMSQKGVPADVVTLCDELERRRQLEEVGGSAFVMDLVKAVPTSIHARHYARIVEFHAIARNLLRGAGQIAQPILFRSVVDLLGFPSGSWWGSARSRRHLGWLPGYLSLIGSGRDLTRVGLGIAWHAFAVVDNLAPLALPHGKCLR